MSTDICRCRNEYETCAVCIDEFGRQQRAALNAKRASEPAPPPEDPEVAFERNLKMMMGTGLNIMLSKRKARGTENIKRQGFYGVINRLSEDKLERVKRYARDHMLREALRERGIDDQTIVRLLGPPETALVGKDQVRDGSSVEDDLLDIANYCYIAIALLRRVW